MSFVFADSPSGGGKEERLGVSGKRSFLLHKAKRRKTNGPSAGAADGSWLLEEAASEANLARALLNVVRNRGAPGVDGQTVEMAEARAPALLARLRRDLLEGRYRPGDVRRVWLPKPGGGQRGLRGSHAGRWLGRSQDCAIVAFPHRPCLSRGEGKHRHVTQWLSGDAARQKRFTKQETSEDNVPLFPDIYCR
jgi:hypothetical protein